MGNKSVAFLAQSVERAALNRAVVGSRPTGGVLFIKRRKEGYKIFISKVYKQYKLE